MRELKENVKKNKLNYSIFCSSLAIATAKKLNLHIKIKQNFNGYGYVITDRYVEGLENIIKLIDALEVKNDITKAKNQRVIEKAQKDFDKILLAIYTINKEAKRQRDIKYKIADSIYSDDAYRSREDGLAHHQMQNAKYNTQYYYSVKNKGIEYIINSKKYDKLEIHEVNNIEMAYISNGKFGFHFDINLLNELGIEAQKSEVVIKEWIDSTKKIKGMSLTSSLAILNNLDA